MRALFPKGKQTKIIDKILSKISIREAAKLCNLSERTIRDWQREKFSVDSKALQKLCQKTSISFPSNVELKNDYWYVTLSSSAGGIAVYKKYGRIGGDPEYRKKKWYKWWEREGRFKQHPIINTCSPIKKSRKSSKLAEFVGIIMGDGGITRRQIIITLHRVDDKKYGNFVIKLIKKLFNVTPSVYHDFKNSVNDIVVSRTELVKFCTSIGLVIGSKVRQQIDIPKWIKKNKKFLIACVRGLIDTDGCVFLHSYKVNNKIYRYKKLAFSNCSKPLIKTVYQFLKKNNFSPRITRDVKDVRIESKNDIKNYFQIIGSHNPKHLKNFLK